MKKRFLFAIISIAVWALTISLPIWSLELTGSSGYSLMDGMSTLVNDNYHLLFMFFSGPAIAIVSLINPKKLLLGTFGFYFIILFCGLLGFTFSKYVELKWGWYIHFASMIGLIILASKLMPEAFENNKQQ
jgi:hypothetical protein